MNFLKTNLNVAYFFKDKLIKIIFASCLFFYFHGAHAISVEPMVFELEPIGVQSSENLRIQNPSSGPITMEITAESLDFDESGNEVNTPAEDDFLIYPPQVIIPAGGAQVVKVKYVGDPLMEKSKAYRIVITNCQLILILNLLV